MWIAVAIVIAGALIAAGILSAMILRRDGGAGGPGSSQAIAATDDGQPSNSETAVPVESPPVASSESSAPTMPALTTPPEHATHYLPPLLADCAHATVPVSGQAVPGIDVLFERAEVSHSCLVPSGGATGARISYHTFENVAAMDDAFAEALGPHIQHAGTPCQERITNGFGDYAFPEDGRSGSAACLLDGDRLWLVWTEDTTMVIGTAFITDTDAETRAALVEFWLTEAGPVPG